MRFIAILPLWLGLMSSCSAAPSQIISFQDITGQYSFGYNEPMSARSESRSSDGLTRGTYSYVDANGQLQTSEYEAGRELGFHVKATNLPQAPLPVQEAPEILAARQKHLQLLEEANRQEENDRALLRNNQGLPMTSMTRDSGEAPKNAESAEALLKTHEPIGIKQGPSTELNQQLENTLRSNTPISGAQILSEANVKSFAFPGFGNGLITDFPDGQSRNLLPLPKGDANFSPFLKSTADFPSLLKNDANPLLLTKGDDNLSALLKGIADRTSLPKSDASSPALPKGDINFPPFLKGNADFLSRFKSDANPLPLPNPNFSPFLKSTADFPSLLKNDANHLLLLKRLMQETAERPSLPKSDAASSPMPKGDANLSPLPKSDASKTAPAILPQRTSGETPEQRMSLPEPVKDTAEVAAARDAHLRAVAEAASKSAEPVKDTPEVMAARQAHLRPDATMPVEYLKFTPEVQAAREAHFRAYQLAAKLAAESDVNPKILEQLLGRPGEPKLGPQRIGGFGFSMPTDKSAEELMRMMGNAAMKVEIPEMKPDVPKGSLLPSENKGIINLAEKPQLKQTLISPEMRFGTGITPASTSLRMPDTRLSSLNEFEQSKLKAEIDLTCGTALKVKDLNDIKPTEDQRLVIIKSGDPAPFISTVPLPIDQSERWKNWAFQYMSL